jgi:hypothetical protein
MDVDENVFLLDEAFSLDSLLNALNIEVRVSGNNGEKDSNSKESETTKETPVKGPGETANNTDHGSETIGEELDAVLSKPGVMDKRSDYNITQANLDLPNIDFIIVDNISNLIPYISQEKIIQFIENLTQTIRKLTEVNGIVIMDNESDPDIQKAIKSNFDKSVSIKEEWL